MKITSALPPYNTGTHADYIAGGTKSIPPLGEKRENLDSLFDSADFEDILWV